MTPERWQEVKEMIRTQFSVEYEGVEELEHGTAEVLEFEGPLGVMRAEYVSKSRQVGRKVLSSHRIGGAAHEELLFSKNETVQHLKLYTWDEAADDWKEIQQQLFS